MFKGFQKPKRLVANTETLTDRFGQFTAQPFQRGFGTTIGNGLRRVLLSSIEGAAITAVRIEGVEHEFSPIPGVVEDATDIILNLKQIPFKIMTEGTKTVRLTVDQAGEVFSGQIQTDQDIEVLDRNLHIATVGEGGKLNIEMRLKTGRGYVSADKNFDEDLALGYIPIDSVHSPVRKVNFTVEAARLGQMTEARGFDGKIHFAHGRMDGVDGDIAEGKILVEILVGADITAAGFEAHLDIELAAFADRGDVQVAVEHFDVLVGLDLAAEDFAGLIDREPDGLGAFGH